MFKSNPKDALSGPETMDLIESLLKNAREITPTTRLVLCGYVDELLGQMKRFVKRPSSSTTSSSASKISSNDGDQAMRERVVRAYLEHAELVEPLGEVKLAQDSQRRASKFGGLSTKETVAPPVQKGKPVMIVATVSDSIFPDDCPRYSSSWSFPKPDKRVEDTPQLVSCLGLLKLAQEDLPKDVLDPVARKWLKATIQTPDEKTRLDGLSMDLVRAFTQDEIKDTKAIAEILCLVPALNREYFRILLDQFLRNLNECQILNVGVLRGVAQVLRSAAPRFLSSQDLINVLGPMSIKLQDTHAQSPEQIFELTVAVSSVLDAMVDAKVAGLKRVEMHEPLLNFLGGLRANDDSHIKFYASYAFQALLRVPDNESRWEATVRRTTTVVRGISGLVSAVKGLDLNAFMNGLQDIQQGFEGIQQLFELGKSAYEGVNAVYESEQDLVAGLKEAFTLKPKRAWYSALRGADTLLDAGELAKFRVLVCGAICRLDVEFQWGICQRLGSVAANPRWGIENRQGAIRFLEEIYRNDLVWGQSPPIKAYILDILKHLSVNDNELPDAVLLLEDLAKESDPIKQAIYKSSVTTPPSRYSLESGPLEFASPSLIDRVQKRTAVETDLRRIARLRSKEQEDSVYIPPMAKSSLRALDETSFDLSPVVEEFLVSDQKVLLLLGDSGVGKTTFNRQLDHKLWKAYESGTGRIPLLINLPGIERPENDLITKHLRLCEFDASQIRELKEREFVVICDGYDESQQTRNLYDSNGLNQPGGWKAQMVISCRSEHLGQDYQDRFRPARPKLSDPDLLLQAVLVPFSPQQVQQYIAAYVAIEKPPWDASDYHGILKQIPSLQDLVRNPFLLMLSLEVLPRLADPGQKLAASKITRAQLYDEFVAQWLERNKKRLGTQELSEQEKEAFENLSDDGFTLRGLMFLQELSAAIYRERGGNPVVDYSNARDTQTWKERFFGRKNNEIRLLRKALPLTRIGNKFGFIHRSILEYGVSRAIYEPQKQSGIKFGAEVETDNEPRKSIDSAFSFLLDEEVQGTADQLAHDEPNADSILVKKSFIQEHSVLQFLVDRVDQEPVFKDQLLGYIKASKTDKKWRLAAANAITILVRADVHFSHQDLRGIRVPGADLSFGVFDSALLQEADLRMTTLQGVWLQQANLSHARMQNARFGEWPALNDGPMTDVFTYTPDGRMFLVATGDKKVIVYNTSTWEVHATLVGHTVSVSHIALSPDSSLAVSGASDYWDPDVDMPIRVWDLKTGQCLCTLSGHTEVFVGLIFLPDSHQVITSSRNRAVHQFEAKTGVRVHSFEVLPDQAMVDAIACSYDGELLASSYEDHSLRIWNIKTTECLHVLTGQASFTFCITFSPKGERLSMISQEGIKTWESKTGNELWTVEKSLYMKEAVAVSADGRLFACGTKENTVILCDADTGKTSLTLIGHTGTISRVVFSRDGTQLCTTSRDQTVRLWSSTGSSGPVFGGYTGSGAMFSPSGTQIASNGEGILRLYDNTQLSGTNMRPRQSHRRPAWVNFVPGERGIFISHCSDWIKEWDLGSGKLVRSVTDDECSFNQVAFSSCDSLVVAMGRQNTARLWDLETGQNQIGFDIDHHESCDHTLTLSDGNRLATTGGANSSEIRVWDRRTGTLEHRLTGHSAEVRSLLFSPNGGLQLCSCSSGTGDQTIRLWEMSTGQCIATMEVPGRVVSFKIVYSQDGSQLHTALVYASSDLNAIHTWDTTTGTSIRVFNTGCATHLDFTPDGQFFVAHSGISWKPTGQNEGTLQVWDMTRGERVWTLGKTEGWMTVAMSPDTQFLVSSNRVDGVIRLWDFRTGLEIARTESYRGGYNSLALDKATIVEGGEEGGTTSLSMAAGTEEGDVMVWKLVRSNGIAGKTNEGTHYKFVLQWTTAYGKLNAAGAKIEGVQGLSRVNVSLLKQNGACGEAVTPLRLDQAVTKIMNAKNFLARLETTRRDATKGDPVPVAIALDNLDVKGKGEGDDREGRGSGHDVQAI